jgi:oligopeptide transport system substrate-binding protein
MYVIEPKIKEEEVFMKKLFALVATLGLVFGLAACGGEDTEDVFRWNIGAEPKTLDPGLNGASDGADVINNTFEGLVREINGEVYPGIAESWDISEDGTTITFHLRESNWSDGTPLTANDFVYAWKRGMDPATASEYSWIWEYTNVKGAYEVLYEGGSLDDVGISALDDYTLVVELNNPTPYFISLTSFFHFMPVKQEAVEAAGGEDGLWASNPELVVSNGPFVLTEYEEGDHLILTKNPEYWNKDEVKLDKIEASFIAVETTAYLKYQNDELDFIPSVPTVMIPDLLALSDEFHVFPLLGTYYYNFNLDTEANGYDPIFDNVKLRTALNYSINRQAIVDALGAGQVPAVGFVPPGFKDDEGNDFFETAGTYGMPIDDSKYAEAQTLFEEAATELGMTVEELRDALSAKTMLYNTSEAHAEIAQMIQEMWTQNLGFTMTLENQDWAIFQGTRSEGNFDLARGGWITDYMDPSGLLSIFTSENAYNDPGYHNETYDTLLSEAAATADIAEHFDKLYQAQEILMTELPIIPVYHYTDSMLVKDYVKDWGRSVLGSVDFSRAYIDEEGN